MKTTLLLLLAVLLLSCEPFNLERIDFSSCVKPSASVGATITKLQVALFVDKSSGDINTVSWTFGDGRGLPQSGAKVTYTYDRPGNYLITMSLTNRCNQTFSATRTITVAN
ncbi:PKD domain-containing protein [Fibrella arboris]|uniref:PKD domain-containing protein n=1 Tax=Fibrella arboris TaxID=3242486 RepID=UPI00351FCACE